MSPSKGTPKEPQISPLSCVPLLWLPTWQAPPGSLTNPINWLPWVNRGSVKLNLKHVKWRKAFPSSHGQRSLFCCCHHRETRAGELRTGVQGFPATVAGYKVEKHRVKWWQLLHVSQKSQRILIKNVWSIFNAPNKYHAFWVYSRPPIILSSSRWGSVLCRSLRTRLSVSEQTLQTTTQKQTPYILRFPLLLQDWGGICRGIYPSVCSNLTWVISWGGDRLLSSPAWVTDS